MSPSTHRTSLLRQQQHRPLKPPKLNERRSRLTFAILVWFAFIVLSVTAAVIGSAVLGYVLAGLYTAARYNVSTFVPVSVGEFLN
ncbi:hypothetical protein ONZ45_g1602 [Pleurotus djamor]|nr:hypothetical protein ONZ45_g14322 [Pleurotus djamor]KAJ8521712.1 hypothetical protein ONZ45_g1602 [Pleurotus djamor]